MRFFLARTDPVQEIAAHPATLPEFTALLRQQAQDPDQIPALRGLGLGLPLIADPQIARGSIYLRPASKEQ